MHDTGVGDEIETFCARDSGGYPGEVIQVIQVTEAQEQFCSKSLQGMIRAAVGQGRQILAERFPQFRDLVSFASREVSLQFAGDCLGGKVCQ